MKRETLSHYEWFLRLKYALVAAGVFKGGNNGVVHIKIDEKSWEHFWIEGYSPIDAVVEDLKNN